MIHQAKYRKNYQSSWSARAMAFRPKIMEIAKICNSVLLEKFEYFLNKEVGK
jgi:hypothetical protein